MTKQTQLTQRQVDWARSHDWFIACNGDFTVTVLERWVNVKTGEKGEDRLVFGDFKALRDWAGY